MPGNLLYVILSLYLFHQSKLNNAALFWGELWVTEWKHLNTTARLPEVWVSRGHQVWDLSLSLKAPSSHCAWSGFSVVGRPMLKCSFHRGCRLVHQCASTAIWWQREHGALEHPW